MAALGASHASGVLGRVLSAPHRARQAAQGRPGRLPEETLVRLDAMIVAGVVWQEVPT
jgi:hypothetical protein